jgi:hypothetical protein
MPTYIVARAGVMGDGRMVPQRPPGFLVPGLSGGG